MRYEGSERRSRIWVRVSTIYNVNSNSRAFLTRNKSMTFRKNSTWLNTSSNVLSTQNRLSRNKYTRLWRAHVSSERGRKKRLKRPKRERRLSDGRWSESSRRPRKNENVSPHNHREKEK